MRSRKLILVAAIAAILAVVLIAVYATRSPSTFTGATVSGHWINPPSEGLGGARASIRIEAKVPITIEGDVTCTTPQGVEYEPAIGAWTLDGKIVTTLPFTIEPGHIATLILVFIGEPTDTLYCTIQTSRGALQVKIS